MRHGLSYFRHIDFYATDQETRNLGLIKRVLAVRAGRRTVDRPVTQPSFSTLAHARAVAAAPLPPDPDSLVVPAIESAGEPEQPPTEEVATASTGDRAVPV